MRKKSHISLARDIANHFADTKICIYKKSFYWGSLLPDCVSSFIIERHTIDVSMYKVKKMTEKLIYEIKLDSSKFWRTIGCVIHYIADFFTFPHTRAFNGGFLEHNNYEEHLKIQLRETVKNGHNHFAEIEWFNTLDGIWNYLEKKQEEYLTISEHTQFTDCQFILRTCHCVFYNILNLHEVTPIDVVAMYRTSGSFNN